MFLSRIMEACVSKNAPNSIHIKFLQLSSGSMATATTHMTAMNVGGRRKEPLVFEPELIGGLKSMSIRKVACGDMFTACLTGKLKSLKLQWLVLYVYAQN